MTGRATEWAWASSKARNGSFTVLLAIADEIDNGREPVMTVAGLAAKSRLSERAVQDATRDLASLGELSATRVKGGNAYRLLLVDHDTEPAESAPRVTVDHITDDAESAPRRICTPPAKPQVKANHAESAPLNFSNDLDLGSVVSGRRSKPRPSEPPRDDVGRLCQHLADRIIANGCRPPSITQKWRDAARLLIDKDGMTEKQVHDAIDWATRDQFWHRNILSMPKLREQYDRLRLAATAERNKRGNAHQPTSGEIDALRSNWAQPLDEMEAGNDPGRDGGPHPVHRGHLPPAED
ncbi:MAG TPA: hypothetical protein VMA72_12460 [Streptosporangiaceae bacterium]|nr:hypothetical protein [Streptosporangiaceae bacterium]